MCLVLKNSVDPDQLASEKPADLDPNCFHCIHKHANKWTPGSKLNKKLMGYVVHKSMQHCKSLGPSINRLDNDGNTKLFYQGFVLALFLKSTTAYKIDSEHTRDYKMLFPVCKVEILQVTVNKFELLSPF